MNSRTKTLSVPVWHKVSTKVLFFVLASCLVTVFAVYAFMVNKTIMNVVAREDLEQEIANLSSTIGELEFKYMSVKSKVTLDLAYEKGFQDAVPSQFVSRTGPALSYNTR
ncbi:MAG: hypothetical protein V4519_02390 [Patescibacteria group bacterium]